MSEINVKSPVSVGSAAKTRLGLWVQGVVQGVGFRPFVYTLATRLGLSGFVYNNHAGVAIEVEGPLSALSTFQRDLAGKAPPLAQIDRITVTTLPATGTEGFHIVSSQARFVAHTGEGAEDPIVERTLVSPDLCICDDCLRELFDPADRRYRYPFINCTNCGPRFTIIDQLPYDRPLTTMASFAMCPTCQGEYDAVEHRRFHAQPNACPNCGPQLEFCWSNNQIPDRWDGAFGEKAHALQGEAALQQAQRVLMHGGIVAVKGIGGYHLACDATNPATVMRLRQRKGRGDKPFAIMARDLAAALQVAHADCTEVALLTSRERPIVLLRKRELNLLALQIAPGNRDLGIMLPYSPLHHLLFAPLDLHEAFHMPAWLVMTSGNYADEPIVIDDDVALAQLSEIADALLMHNRAIRLPCDDSVVRGYNGWVLPLRRSRGYAPLPLKLPFAVPPLLAVGAELKNTFCLAKGQDAFMSQHIGDMQDVETLENFGRIFVQMKSLFHIEPEVVVCDLHPGYLSSYWAEEYVEERRGAPRLVKVQHHHAHIAGLMAEHGLPEGAPVIGFSFDGTGYGTDGTIWGGEIFVADYLHCERVAHLNCFPLPGGDIAVRRPYRTALAALWAAGLEWNKNLPPVAATTSTEREVLQQQLAASLNCVQTSSMGRLFDVIATLAGVRQTIDYEGQAAIELEAFVDAGLRESYHFTLPTPEHPWFDATPVLQAAVADAIKQLSPARIATRFHNAVTNLIVEMSLVLRPRTGINKVALSGGVFQNMALLRPTVQHLQAAGFEVLVHRTLPPNDGGLALGQAVIAAAQIRAAEAG